MAHRTDIAVEFLDNDSEKLSGVTSNETTENGVKITEVEILTLDAAKRIGKPKGRYITFETEDCFNINCCDELCEVLTKKLCSIMGNTTATTLVVGIGNMDVTPDALGPKAAKGVLATRHIESQLADSIGLNGLKPVVTVSPGVLGQTGLEISEIIEGVISKCKVGRAILIDALAARDVERLGRTVQISNTGIIPGSGVGNSRIELSAKTLGVDCITIGVPTVVDAKTLCEQLTGVGCPQNEPFIVTQREIDMIIKNAADLISKALNLALQPDIDKELLLSISN